MADQYFFHKSGWFYVIQGSTHKVLTFDNTNTIVTPDVLLPKAIGFSYSNASFAGGNDFTLLFAPSADGTTVFVIDISTNTPTFKPVLLT